ARTARPKPTAACEVCAIVPTARTSDARRTSAAAERVLVPARAAFEPALRLQERLHVDATEQHRRLRVPREHRLLGGTGEEQLHDGRICLDVCLLLHDELERAVRDELEVVRQQIVAATFHLPAQPQTPDRATTRKRPRPVDGEEPTYRALSPVRRLHHGLL